MIKQNRKRDSVFIFGGAMTVLRVHLRDDERAALLKLAQVERRNLAPQAALLLREKLIERGLLPATKQPELQEASNVHA